MRVSFKSFIAGFACCALLSATTAYAAVGSTRIEVFFKDIKYMIDGEQKQPAPDKQGFVYKGTTYVPIRFVGESLGKEVLWDPDQETVWVSDDPGELTLDDLGIADAVTGAEIQLGMTREDVEKQLGEPIDEFVGRYNYDGLQVYYRDGKAVGFIINASDNETDRFKTTRGIGLGTPYRDVLSQYGSPRGQESTYGDFYDSSIIYLFKDEEGILEKLTSRLEPWDTSKVYYLSMNVFNNGNRTIGFLLIGDKQFAMNSN